MPLPLPKPCPPPVNVQLLDHKTMKVTPEWAAFFASVGGTLALLSQARFNSLVNAANDTAAAAAGVQIGGLYRNGNAVQIRLV